MVYSFQSLELRLKTPFRIAHGTSTTRTNILVRIGDGIGEGALPPYYPYTLDDVRSYLQDLDLIALLDGKGDLLEDALDRLPSGPPPALTALDLALHDHWARQLGHPLYRLWGLNPERAPDSSITLSIPESPDALRSQIEVYDGFPILKLKLGTGDLRTDERLVRAARDATNAHLCVDANGAWSVNEAATVIPRLAAYDLLFIEQPLPSGTHDAWHQLRSQLPDDVPYLIADESVQHPTDLLVLADAIDGVNIKLTKAGGLRAARRMISLARTLGLKTMLGCMIESSVALTAAAHLAPLVDYADLDGYLHLAADPYEGMSMHRGRIHLPDRPGLGVIERAA